MATPRTQQVHQQRVDRIAADAAEKIAADSPIEEDVIVTVEEVPPTARGESAGADAASSALEVMSPVSPTHFVDTAATVVTASIAFTQRVVAAQLRYAARMVNAVRPDAA